MTGTPFTLVGEMKKESWREGKKKREGERRKEGKRDGKGEKQRGRGTAIKKEGKGERVLARKCVLVIHCNENLIN